MQYGVIYKITNIKTNKIYIGQTIKTIEDRFLGHVKAANKGCNFKLSRAIRKYGVDNFKIEIIDVAESKCELNEKEIFYINKYNSNVDGYNMTSGGEGGDTYQCKTEQEMLEISKKISKALHENNGNRGQFVGPKNGMYEKHHTKESKMKMSKSLKGKKFSKEHNQKISKYYKGRKKHYLHPHTKLVVLDIKTKLLSKTTAKEVISLFNISNYIELKNIVDNKTIIHNKFIISKSVSTIPDECMGVEVEISTTAM